MEDCAMVDHCYTDIGCFPLGPEFYHPKHRPFNVRPWHRNRINTRFEIYNHKHPNGFLLDPWDSINLKLSGFDPSLETKILIPGWLDSIKRTVWLKRAKDAFLWLWHPVNIIVVYWRNFTPYTIATANSRVVGAELANFMKWVNHEFSYDPIHYHLIGHSLGAHISGYCGDRIPGLGRITALDPARPFFQHMPKSVRLDRGDARFVDAIHSDFTPENAIFLIMSFGMTTPVGHLDFYPNGPPLLQPGCLRDTLLSVRNGIRKGLEYSSLPVAFLEAGRYLTACDHQRSHEWFVESLTNRQCLFVGVRCNDFDGLINGRCTCDDSPSACAIMGIHADQMYLNGVHNDLWPLKQPHNSQRLRMKDKQTSLPITSTFINEAIPKDEAYSHMKHLVSKFRNEPKSMATSYNQLLLSDFGGIHDPTFIRFLLAHFDQDQHGAYLHQDPIISKRNFFDPDNILNDIDEELEILLEPTTGGPTLNDVIENKQNLFVPNQHPFLMSDLDRDIEQWYEDSSRWYLKTNNRPNYCVNQYQVLVYMGPLSTETGHDYLKANLIISIIGSRGQLINQRFVPRASRLSSFTLQPFFIVLESSYSLGNILSVAVSWESRKNPDPIQASISFRNNPLEMVQTFWPTFTAKHPWLSETYRYDYNDGHLESSRRNKRHFTTARDPKKPPKIEMNRLAKDRQDTTKATRKERCHSNDRKFCKIVEAEPRIEAELNSINAIHDIFFHDTIVIRQVTISPLKATYGKSKLSTGRTFCPPHRNFRLRRDHSAKLEPRLTGRCH